MTNTRTTNPAPATPPAPLEPLRAFGADGQIVGLSYDGGGSWVTTPAGQAARQPSPVEINFHAKVCAVMTQPSPSFERRIVAPFSAFRRERVLAGWAGPEFLATLPPGEIDILTLPGLAAPPDVVASLREQVRGIVLDLDEPLPGKHYDEKQMATTIALADVVTVPTGKMAQELRKHHPNVYEIPPVLDGELWKGLKKPLKRGEDKLVVGVTNPEDNQALTYAIDQLQERYGEVVEFVSYDWWQLDRAEERDFYPTLDIAVVGDRGPFNSGYPALAAAIGGAAVVAGRGYGKVLKHGSSGVVVGQVDDHRFWRKAVSELLHNARRREMLGRNARNDARRSLAGAHTNQLLLPYKLLSQSKLARVA